MRLRASQPGEVVRVREFGNRGLGLALAIAASLSGCQVSGAPLQLSAPPATRLEQSVALQIARGDYDRKTINVFMPWHYDIYDPARYGLAWAASPDKREGTITLAEVFWAYNYLGKEYSNYPGIDAFIMDAPWNKWSSSGGKARLDYGNPAFPDYIARVAGDRAMAFHADGVMLDWWTNNHPNGVSEVEVREIRTNIAAAIREINGADFLIVGNTNWNKERATHAYLNGVYLEMYKPTTGPYTASELRQIEDLLIYHDEYLQAPKIVALEGQRITRELSDRDRTTDENVALARLFAAMATVIPRNGYVQYADNNDDDSEGDHFHFFYGFYDIDYGKPVSGRTKVADGIWYRAFEWGIVAFNRTENEAEVTFENGGVIDLPPRSGAFCRTIEGGFLCE